MSCTSLTTITKSCDNNIGGIRQVWLWDMDQKDIITSVFKENGYGTPSIDPNTIYTWEVYEIRDENDDLIAPTSYEFIRNSSNYTEEQATDLVAGSTFIKTTLNLVFTRREASKSRSIKILGEGQRYLGALVLDSNGIYWLFEDLQISNVAEGSGTAKADGSKYTVTLMGETPNFAGTILTTQASNFIDTGSTENP